VTDGRLGQIQSLGGKSETSRIYNRDKRKHLTNFWHVAVHGGDVNDAIHTTATYVPCLPKNKTTSHKGCECREYPEKN
jgi:hypothetical protein